MGVLMSTTREAVVVRIVIDAIDRHQMHAPTAELTRYKLFYYFGCNDTDRCN